MRHFAIQEDHWYSMLPEDRKKHMVKFENSDVLHTKLSVKERNLETTKVTDGFSLLAKAALALNEKGEKIDDHLSVTMQDFRQYLPNLSESTANGIYKKACTLVHHVVKMTIFPEGNPKSQMVASTRLREHPHLIEKGKAEGEYKCEKTCPHYNALKLCSHVIVTAEANEDLKVFLQFYTKKKEAEKMNLSRLLRTDMPSNPGCKGGKPSTSRRSTSKLPIEKRCRKSYPSSCHTNKGVNVNPFVLKKMNLKIKICQGCRKPLKTSLGEIPFPPYDICISRKEQRPFFDKTIGDMRTPSRETDSHYHLNADCIRAVEKAFDPHHICVPEDLTLDNIHKEKIKAEFHVNLY